MLKNSDFWSVKRPCMILRTLLLLLALVIVHQPAFAHAEQADFMRSMGKLYVVVAVILAIFLGIVIFLVYLDRKLTNIENQIGHHE